MTLPHEDDRLVDFLRRHRPEPPVADSDLENQIMAAIDRENARPHPSHPFPQPRKRNRSAWRSRLAIPALAASVLLAWGGWVSLRPQVSQEADLDTVEAFLTETWYGSAYEDSTYRIALNTNTPGWLLSVYATPY